MRMDKLRDCLNKELAKGLSRRELGKKIGIPFTSIDNYLTADTQPRIQTLQKIADYFRLPITFFLDEGGDIENQMKPSGPSSRGVPPPPAASPSSWEIKALIESMQSHISRIEKQNDGLMDRINEQGKALSDALNHVNSLNESMNELNAKMVSVTATLGGEIGEIKTRMIDTALSGDLKVLGKIGDAAK
jgi:transcriptional regulator with XRE-family HTH domain